MSAGLLWQGEQGVYLSEAAGTRLLVSHADLSAVSEEDGWVVVAERRGPEAGRIGGPLAPVAGLRRCPPIDATGVFSEDRLLETIADGELYAVVHGACLRGRPQQAQLLVRIPFGSRRLEVVGKVPSGALSLAAAGSRIALTYNAGRKHSVRVDVVDSRDARPLFTLMTPPDEAELSYGQTMIDAMGDVLVAGESYAARAAVEIPVHQAWWGTPRTRVAQRLPARVGASLSEGQIAYNPSGRVEGERIDVLEIAAGTTRTAVTFSGSASLEGFALGADVLAWSQRSYAYKRTTTTACVGLFAVGDTELNEVPLPASGPPITVSASPRTPPTGEPCPPPA